MRLKNFSIVIFMLGIITVAGCRTAPIYNVQQAAIPTTSSKEVKEDDVKNAIIRAGSSLGWNMSAPQPGKINGSIQVRDHQAVVEIPYSATSYSILYKDSQNLKYNGNTIHSNYNSWVQNLDRAIKTQLSLIQ